MKAFLTQLNLKRKENRMKNIKENSKYRYGGKQGAT
jgi:hypothetical protein